MPFERAELWMVEAIVAHLYPDGAPLDVEGARSLIGRIIGSEASDAPPKHHTVQQLTGIEASELAQKLQYLMERPLIESLYAQLGLKASAKGAACREPSTMAAPAEDAKQPEPAKQTEEERKREAMRRNWERLEAKGVFSELTKSGGCSIEKTEERSIDLTQLEQIKTHIVNRLGEEPWMVTRCVDNTWKQVEVSDPEQVNLYDVNQHVILPCTWKRRCSMVEMLASSSQPPDFFTSHVRGTC